MRMARGARRRGVKSRRSKTTVLLSSHRIVTNVARVECGRINGTGEEFKGWALKVHGVRCSIFNGVWTGMGAENTRDDMIPQHIHIHDTHHTTNKRRLKLFVILAFPFTERNAIRDAANPRRDRSCCHYASAWRRRRRQLFRKVGLQMRYRSRIHRPSSGACPRSGRVRNG